MEIRLAIPDRVLDGPTLDAALEATTRANEALARHGQLPDLGEAIANGLRWQPEPWVGERFDLAPTVARRGWGDCDDLGPWLAAQMRHGGEPAQAFAVQSGPGRWHVKVRRPDGEVLDPSCWAGMPSKSCAAYHRPLAHAQRPIGEEGESSLCAVPWEGQWHVRSDLPMGGFHVGGWASDPDLGEAMERSIAGYALLAEGLYGHDIGSGIGDLLSSVGAWEALGLGKPLGRARRSPMASQSRAVCGEVCGEGESPEKEAPKEGKPPPAATPLVQLHEAMPRGWPKGGRMYALPGPGGHGKARLACVPGGGPVLVVF